MNKAHPDKISGVERFSLQSNFSSNTYDIYQLLKWPQHCSQSPASPVLPELHQRMVLAVLALLFPLELQLQKIRYVLLDKSNLVDKQKASAQTREESLI